MAESLGSRYVRQEVLGRGAMGQVFTGSVRSTGEQVAIKVLRPELVSDPENVLVDTSAGGPLLKLTDFGVARLSCGASLTKLSGVIGTPEYMAPELVEQNRATPAADVYSAGIVLYEIVLTRAKGVDDGSATRQQVRTA